jgi:hypothetical protein
MRMRRVLCKDCGREIQTIGHGLSIEGAPVVCRKCFGVQTYANVSGRIWVYAPMAATPGLATLGD